MVKVKLKYLVGIISAVVILSIVYVGMTGFFIKTPVQSGAYDDFAKCLTDKGAVFYGSYQCGHCGTQKEMFGNSIKHVNYVECGPLNGPVNQVCREAGIQAYPTWIIGNVKYVGVQGFDTLSKLTNCPL